MVRNSKRVSWAPADLCGQLYRQAHTDGPWKQRFCALQGSQLCLYRTAASAHPLEVLDLQNAQVSSSKRPKQKSRQQEASASDPRELLWIIRVTLFRDDKSQEAAAAGSSRKTDPALGRRRVMQQSPQRVKLAATSPDLQGLWKEALQSAAAQASQEISAAAAEEEEEEVEKAAMVHSSSSSRYSRYEQPDVAQQLQRESAITHHHRLSQISSMSAAGHTPLQYGAKHAMPPSDSEYPAWQQQQQQAQEFRSRSRQQPLRSRVSDAAVQPHPPRGSNPEDQLAGIRSSHISHTSHHPSTPSHISHISHISHQPNTASHISHQPSRPSHISGRPSLTTRVSTHSTSEGRHDAFAADFSQLQPQRASQLQFAAALLRHPLSEQVVTHFHHPDDDLESPDLFERLPRRPSDGMHSSNQRKRASSAAASATAAGDAGGYEVRRGTAAGSQGVQHQTTRQSFLRLQQQQQQQQHRQVMGQGTRRSLLGGAHSVQAALEPQSSYTGMHHDAPRRNIRDRRSTSSDSRIGARASSSSSSSSNSSSSNHLGEGLSSHDSSSSSWLRSSERAAQAANNKSGERHRRRRRHRSHQQAQTRTWGAKQWCCWLVTPVSSSSSNGSSSSSRGGRGSNSGSDSDSHNVSSEFQPSAVTKNIQKATSPAALIDPQAKRVSFQKHLARLESSKLHHEQVSKRRLTISEHRHSSSRQSLGASDTEEHTRFQPRGDEGFCSDLSDHDIDTTMVGVAVSSNDDIHSRTPKRRSTSMTSRQLLNGTAQQQQQQQHAADKPVHRVRSSSVASHLDSFHKHMPMRSSLHFQGGRQHGAMADAGLQANGSNETKSRASSTGLFAGKSSNRDSVSISPGFHRSSEQNLSSPGFVRSSRQSISSPGAGSSSSRRSMTSAGIINSSRQSISSPGAGSSSRRSMTSAGIINSSRQSISSPGHVHPSAFAPHATDKDVQQLMPSQPPVLAQHHASRSDEWRHDINAAVSAGEPAGVLLTTNPLFADAVEAPDWTIPAADWVAADAENAAAAALSTPYSTHGTAAVLEARADAEQESFRSAAGAGGWSADITYSDGSAHDDMAQGGNAGSFMASPVAEMEAGTVDLSNRPLQQRKSGAGMTHADTMNVTLRRPDVSSVGFPGDGLQVGLHTGLYSPAYGTTAQELDSYTRGQEAAADQVMDMLQVTHLMSHDDEDMWDPRQQVSWHQPQQPPPEQQFNDVLQHRVSTTQMPFARSRHSSAGGALGSNTVWVAVPTNDPRQAAASNVDDVTTYVAAGVEPEGSGMGWGGTGGTPRTAAEWWARRKSSLSAPGHPTVAAAASSTASVEVASAGATETEAASEATVQRLRPLGASFKTPSHHLHQTFDHRQKQHPVLPEDVIGSSLSPDVPITDGHFRGHGARPSHRYTSTSTDLDARVLQHPGSTSPAADAAAAAAAVHTSIAPSIASAVKRFEQLALQQPPLPGATQAAPGRLQRPGFGGNRTSLSPVTSAAVKGTMPWPVSGDSVKPEPVSPVQLRATAASDRGPGVTATPQAGDHGVAGVPAYPLSSTLPSPPAGSSTAAAAAAAARLPPPPPPLPASTVLRAAPPHKPAVGTSVAAQGTLDNTAAHKVLRGSQSAAALATRAAEALPAALAAAQPGREALLEAIRGGTKLRQVHRSSLIAAQMQGIV